MQLADRAAQITGRASGYHSPRSLTIGVVGFITLPVCGDLYQLPQGSRIPAKPGSEQSATKRSASAIELKRSLDSSPRPRDSQI